MAGLPSTFPAEQPALDEEHFRNSPTKYAGERLLVILAASDSLWRDVDLLNTAKWFAEAKESDVAAFVNAVNYTSRLLILYPINWLGQRISQLDATAKNNKVFRGKGHTLSSLLDSARTSVRELREAVSELNLLADAENRHSIIHVDSLRAGDPVPFASPREILYKILLNANTDTGLARQVFDTKQDPRQVLQNLGKKMGLPTIYKDALPHDSLSDGTPPVYFLCLGKPGHNGSRTMIVGATAQRWNPFTEIHQILRKARDARIGSFQHDTEEAFRRLEKYEQAHKTEIEVEWSKSKKRFKPNDVTFEARKRAIESMGANDGKIGGGWRIRPGLQDGLPATFTTMLRMQGNLWLEDC